MPRVSPCLIQSRDSSGAPVVRLGVLLLDEYLEFLAGRYRDEPAVYGWELWNEMNAVQGGGDYLGWTAAMLNRGPGDRE